MVTKGGGGRKARRRAKDIQAAKATMSRQKAAKKQDSTLGYGSSGGTSRSRYRSTLSDKEIRGVKKRAKKLYGKPKRGGSSRVNKKPMTSDATNAHCMGKCTKSAYLKAKKR